MCVHASKHSCSHAIFIVALNKKNTILFIFFIIGQVSFLPVRKAISQDRQIRGQMRCFLDIKVSSVEKSLLRKYDYKKNHHDSLSAAKELQKLMFTLQRHSYIASTADSVWYSFDTLKVMLNIGEPYQWAYLKKGNVSENLLNRVGYKEKFYSDQPFHYNDVVKLEKKLLEHSENHGYPFASIKLDSINISKNEWTGDDGRETIGASLDFIKGPLIKFDSMVIKGDTKIKKRFLTKYIRVIPGEPYSQEKVENAGKLIRRLPYLKVTKSPIVTFSPEKAFLTLYFDDKKANQINGIVGFLPNEEEDNKLLINGEFNLRLLNPFGTGKSFTAEWKKLKKFSQTLDLEYLHPNLIGSNVEAKLNFNLFKQDTTFVNLNGRVTLAYHFGKIGKAGFFYSIKSTRLGSTKQYEGATKLPDYADTDYKSYGLVYEWNNLDDYYYPKKGFIANAELGIGNKEIKKNARLPDTLYIGIDLKTTQISFSANIEHYLKISTRSVFLSGLKAGSLINENLFLNDLFRIGGLSSLRGFNELIFFASTYTVGTLEYRFFTDETSYLLIFYDQGYLMYDLLDGSSYEDIPFGIGAGISFSTRAGIFNFIYSVGKSKFQPIGLNNSKIHFGLISRF